MKWMDRLLGFSKQAAWPPVPTQKARSVLTEFPFLDSPRQDQPFHAGCGWCLCCGTQWQNLPGWESLECYWSTPTSQSSGMFPLCRKCRSARRAEEALPYYALLYHKWLVQWCVSIGGARDSLELVNRCREGFASSFILFKDIERMVRLEGDYPKKKVSWSPAPTA